MVPKLQVGGLSILYAASTMFLARRVRESRSTSTFEFVRLRCLGDDSIHDFPDEQAAHEFAKTYEPVKAHEIN